MLDPQILQEPKPQEQQMQVELRRSKRRRTMASSKYPKEDYITLIDNGEPQNFSEAMESIEKGEWIKAMEEEMSFLHENHTYDLMELPTGRKALKNKWVHKLKIEEESLTPRYKTRIVVKGCNQRK